MQRRKIYKSAVNRGKKASCASAAKWRGVGARLSVSCWWCADWECNSYFLWRRVKTQQSSLSFHHTRAAANNKIKSDSQACSRVTESYSRKIIRKAKQKISNSTHSWKQNILYYTWNTKTGISTLNISNYLLLFADFIYFTSLSAFCFASAVRWNCTCRSLSLSPVIKDQHSFWKAPELCWANLITSCTSYKMTQEAPQSHWMKMFQHVSIIHASVENSSSLTS